MIDFSKTGIPGFGSATSNIGRGNQQQGLNLPWGGQQQQPTQMGYQQGRAPSGRPGGIRPPGYRPPRQPTQAPTQPSAPTQAPTPQPTQAPIQQSAPSQAIASTISPSVSSRIANTFNPNITFNPTFNPSLTLGPQWGNMFGGGGGFTPWSTGGFSSIFQTPPRVNISQWQGGQQMLQPWGGGGGYGGFSPWQAGGQQGGGQPAQMQALAPGADPSTPDYFINPAQQGGQPTGVQGPFTPGGNLPPWQPGMPLRM